MQSTDKGPVIVVSGEAADDLEGQLAWLTQDHNITRVMVECGPGLATAFFDAGLIDEVFWFRAPVTVGPDGTPALHGVSVAEALQRGGFEATGTQMLVEDRLETFVKGAY